MVNRIKQTVCFVKSQKMLTMRSLMDPNRLGTRHFPFSMSWGSFPVLVGAPFLIFLMMSCFLIQSVMKDCMLGGHGVAWNHRIWKRAISSVLNVKLLDVSILLKF